MVENWHPLETYQWIHTHPKFARYSSFILNPWWESIEKFYLSQTSNWSWLAYLPKEWSSRHLDWCILRNENRFLLTTDIHGIGRESIHPYNPINLLKSTRIKSSRIKSNKLNIYLINQWRTPLLFQELEKWHPLETYQGIPTQPIFTGYSSFILNTWWESREFFIFLRQEIDHD